MNDAAEQLPMQEIAATGIDRMIDLAISSDADVDKLGKMLDLKERYDKEEAKKQYFESLRLVQAAGIQIKRDARNQQTNSNYALLETINRALIPVYTEHGFSLSFGEDTSQKEGHIRMAADIYHSAGHFEHKWAELPLDDSGLKGNVNKTGTHATGSTFSYARRYLTLLIFNINTGDDDDGQEAGRGELERLSNHYAAVKENFWSIVAIKDGLAKNNSEGFQQAVEAYDELPEGAKYALKLASTKGGIFETEETNKIKSDEWGAARRALRGSE